MGKYIIYRNYETCQDGIIAHGDGNKKHKYIARVKVKNNKYRYFYTQEEYQNYLNGKKKKKSVFGNNLLKSIKSFSKKVVDKGADFLDKFQNKKVAKGKEYVDKIGSTKIGDLKTFKNSGLYVKAMNFVSSLFTTVITKLFKPKYIAKVTLPNGRYRYFYNQDEYDSYLERLNYQKNEPSFMKGVPDIPDNIVYTAMQDMSKVNEKFSPYDRSSSTNCTNCSAAYELRRRGYDVEAKLADASYNGRSDRVFDYFEGAELISIYSDGSTKVQNEKAIRKICDGKFTAVDSKVYKEEYEFYTQSQNYTSQSIEKAIKSNNPPGSRGFIDVDWKAGGAHSIVYEVDNSGKVTIRDSQTYDEYSLDELASNVSRVRIARTDNLQVKKDILNAVKVNEDADRNYYVDNNTLIAT